MREILIFLGIALAVFLALSAVVIWSIAQCHYVPKKKDRRKDK